MATFRNQDYLLNDQYKDGSNFNARVELHRRFSTNTVSWHPWVFDQLKLAEGSTLLELGCGPGFLWRGNRERIPASWHITLSDFSAGILEEARQHLGEARFTYQVADAQALPFGNENFDAVIANHMLYHIPNVAQALQEIQRVLKPNGHLYASTVGRTHMHEMDALLAKAEYNPVWQNFKQSAPFTLENGEEVLTPFFEQIKLYIYEDALEVTEAEPLIAYALSGKLGQTVNSEKRAVLKALIEQDLALHGMMHISKASGLFVAQKV